MLLRQKPPSRCFNYPVKHIYLYAFADDAERYQQVLQAIEHELGHAMGLDHNTKVPSVMDTEGRYPIQPVDVKNVKKLYHK